MQKTILTLAALLSVLCLFAGAPEVTAVTASQQENLVVIDYYLAHDDERLAIAVEGQRHVRENHTYMNRMREVLNLAATPGDNG